MSSTGIIWARVSTAEQAWGYSIDAQEELLSKAAANKKIDIVRTFRVHETGSRHEVRKHFREMVGYVRECKVGTILVFKIDRLARNWKDFYKVQDLIDGGAAIYVVSEEREYSLRSSSTDRFHFRVIGDVAQLEAEQIGERTVLGMNRKLAQGKIVWECPIGYLNAADPSDILGRKRTVVVDEARAPLVKRAFELYAAGGHSVNTLTDELNQLGLRSKDGKRRPSAPVTRRCVEEMLKNHFYIGEFWDKKIGAFRKHDYPKLVSRALFDRVQRRMVANNRNTKGRRDHERFFFKSFLGCGYCGAQITAYSPKAGHAYYDCTKSHFRTNGKKNCSKSVIYPEKRIDATIAAAIGKLYIDDTIADRIRRHLASANDAEEADMRREQRRLTARFTERTNHLDLVYEDRLAGKLSADEYMRFKDKIQSEIGSVQSRLAKLSKHNFDYKDQGSAILDVLKGFREVYATQDYEGKAAILKVMLKSVTLRGNEADFAWYEPFDTMFSIGELVLSRKKWGASVNDLITLLSHSPQAATLKALAQGC